MTTAGTVLSLQSFVFVFARYLLVKAVMAFVALSTATACSSGVRSTAFNDEAARKWTMGGAKALVRPPITAATSSSSALAILWVVMVVRVNDE